MAGSKTPLCALLVSLLSTAVQAQVELISPADPSQVWDTASGGPEVDGTPIYPPAAVSADGRYATFVSRATNLVPGQVDVNEVTPFSGMDVFLHDRVAGTLVLVSSSTLSPTRAGNKGSSALVSISADGRYVAFVSRATDLVPGQVDKNEWWDAFVYDRVTATTALVSRVAGTTATAAGGVVYPAVLSEDGSQIAFVSTATNLVAGGSDTNDTTDVFLFERSSGAVTLVSRAAGQAGVAAGGASDEPKLSADGRYVAFYSKAGNLVAGQVQPPDGENTFLYDRVAGTMALVSHTSASAVTSAGSLQGHGLSADGRYVAFSSRGNSVMPGQTDTNGSFDVFLYDRLSGSSILVSHVPGSFNQTGDSGSAGGSFFSPLLVSADGSQVVFYSYAKNLVPDQTGPPPGWFVSNVFLFSRQDRSIQLVSHTADSTSNASWGTETANLSADGRYVTFSCATAQMVPGEDPAASGSALFVYDRTTATNRLITRTGGSATLRGNGGGSGADLSADGQTIVFYSSSTDLIPGLFDLNRGTDVFLFDQASATNSILTRHAAGMASASPELPSDRPSVSGDGRYVTFVSAAAALLPGVTTQPWLTDNVYLRDRATGTTTMISHAAGSPNVSAGSSSRSATISRDGNWIVFVSGAGNLVPGQIDTNWTYPTDGTDIFLRDRAAGTTILVSHAAGSAVTTGNAESLAPVISADGRYIAYLSRATDLVASATDTNGAFDVFLYDRVAGTTTLLSHASSSPSTAADAWSDAPAVSEDGSVIAFTSAAADLLAGQGAVLGSNVFLFEAATGDLTLASRSLGSSTSPANAASSRAVLGGDGRHVAFVSLATDLVSGFLGAGQENVWIFDRISGTTRLVSGVNGSATMPGNAPSNLGDLSDDGRSVAFVSQATDLVPDQSDTNAGWDVFLFDRETGTLRLASRAVQDPEVARGGVAPSLSADGRYVTFLSAGTDLIPGQIDAPETADLFVWDLLQDTMRLVTRALDAPWVAGNSPSSAPVFAANGDGVLFVSRASNLVAHDYNGQNDVFFALLEEPAGLDFYTLSPCRLFDSRLPANAPALASGTTRLLALHGACGIPATAVGVAVNVTVLQPAGSGYVTLYPGDRPVLPLASTVNFTAGQLRSNNAILSLSTNGTGTLAITPAMNGGGTVHLILDVAGYFE